jgi:predicted ATPase/class 3 adenylate cyclase
MTEASPPTPPSGGTRTFLFSDIEGSTRLEQELGTARYAALRERHRELLRKAFKANGGIEQGTEGDSFFVVFPSARSGLVAAVEAQRALVAEPWPDGASVRVRMGLHAGEAALVGGSLVGLDVNRAARIAATGSGGQVVVSDAIRSLVAGDLPAGVTLRPLGSHRLRDLRDPEPLAQVVAEGLPDTFPPLRSVDARPNNLPTQLTSFVGRETELAEAGGLLANNRLVTLTGPGGTGKTRLSLQVAAAAAASYPDGMFFVPLETVREPALVPSRITAAIGLAESSRPTLEVLRDWLASRTVLLVLDNLEQVIGAGPILADLLRSTPGLSVLATSRAPLHVSGEQEYQVPGLPAPPDPTELSALDRARLGAAGAAALDPATLSMYEAVRLFIARASAVRPGFQVTNDNAPAVAAITARLHGMPLPIELAAARVKLLSPDAILSRLEHQLGVLAAGSRDLPERQQTLRGAIAWSYDLLDEGTRRLLDRLSVFRGTFDLGAAEAACGPAAELGIDVLDGLLSLADQSLLRSVEMAGEPRFTMLETIREFAAEMLDARGDRAEIERRHSAWYLDLVQRAQAELSGTDQRAWLERLEEAHDNIRAVLDRAVVAADAETAIGLAFAAWRFWQKRGHLYEARRRLDEIAAAPWSSRDPVLHARLLEALGGVAWWQGDIRTMRPAYREAVDLWRSLGDRAELANALYNYSFTFTVPDDPSGEVGNLDPDGVGYATLEEALGLYRELGDERGEGNVLWGLGNKAFFARTGDGGAAKFAAALEKFRQVGDRTMEAWSLHMLGGAQVRTGSLPEAGDNLRHALRHFYEAGDAAGVTLVLDDLASLALALDDLERAARLWGAARNLTNATGASLAGFVDGWIEQEVRPNVRKALAPDALAALAHEGAAMSLDQAVAYGLDLPVEALATPHPETPA